MSGYKINEHSLYVTFRVACMRLYLPSVVTSIPDAPDTPDSSPEVKPQDGRRNLYVLGLPYDLTK